MYIPHAEATNIREFNSRTGPNFFFILRIRHRAINYTVADVFDFIEFANSFKLVCN